MVTEYSVINVCYEIIYITEENGPRSIKPTVTLINTGSIISSQGISKL